MKQSTKIYIGALIIVVAIGYLMFTGFSNFSGYQVTVSDIVNGQEDYGEDFLMVPGQLVGGTTNFDGKNIKLTFTMTDGSAELPVVYNDVKPDNFEEATEVILEGYYDKAANVFRAEKLTTKCPSKYEAESTDSQSAK